MQALRVIIKAPQGSKWRYRPVKTGAIIIRQGRASQALYLIDKGRVQVAARGELPEGQQLQSGLAAGEPAAEAAPAQ